MRAYYGARFSPNMTKTPEGYLVCHNVPIARTGWQEYLGQEIGADDLHGKIIQVYRDPEQVFDRATMASFEGKPITDEHPPEEVRPDNISNYLKGILRDVRRGTGDDGDLLLADIIIYDPKLISEVENGKREVSCGYECIYVPMEDEGQYAQTRIRGNHVAVVTKGRAGDRVAIKDSAIPEDLKPIKTKEGSPKMRTKVTLKGLIGLGFKQFVADANVDPEEVMDAVEEIGAKKEAPAPAPAPAPAAPAGGGEEGGGLAERVGALEGMVKDLIMAVKELVQSDKQVHEEASPLDGLEAELKGAAGGGAETGEEAVTVPAEEMQDDAGPTLSGEELPKNPIPGADAALNMLRIVKPFVAAIPDPVERKKVADSLSKEIRAALKQPVKPAQNYAKALNPAKPANDSKEQVDQTQLGKDWAKQFNPHYKEVK